MIHNNPKLETMSVSDNCLMWCLHEMENYLAMKRNELIHATTWKNLNTLC